MVVVGEDAASEASVLVQMLATEPDLMERVKAAVRLADVAGTCISRASTSSCRRMIQRARGAGSENTSDATAFSTRNSHSRSAALRQADDHPAPPAIEGNPTGGTRDADEGKVKRNKPAIQAKAQTA